MSNLPMPSEVREAAREEAPIVEPPSAKLIVRLFLIPFLIVAAAVGVMFLIGLLAGRTPTAEEAIARLRNAGGGRTADYLIGPGSKQRYLDAKALTDYMKSQMASGQMPATERVKISNDLLDILEHHTSADEGEVRHFLLLALGRAWQVDPRRPTEDTPESLVARQRAVDALLKFAGAKELPTRKAAVLATVYLKGHGEAMPVIIAALATKLRDTAEDLDVRMAAATALGPLATPADRDAIDALHEAMRDTDPQHVELVWQSALSLAQLDDATVADTILKLLSRDELAQLQVYDREKDPKNPVFRTLSEAEQERILINTMIGVEGYDVPSVQEKLRHIAATDPSQRVRAALQSNTPRDAASGAR